jgi:hypothetical protein
MVVVLPVFDNQWRVMTTVSGGVSTDTKDEKKMQQLKSELFCTEAVSQFYKFG